MSFARSNDIHLHVFNKNKKNSSLLTELPNEVILYIASFLDLKSLIHFAKTNRQVHHIVTQLKKTIVIQTSPDLETGLSSFTYKDMIEAARDYQQLLKEREKLQGTLDSWGTHDFYRDLGLSISLAITMAGYIAEVFVNNGRFIELLKETTGSNFFASFIICTLPAIGGANGMALSFFAGKKIRQHCLSLQERLEKTDDDIKNHRFITKSFPT